MTAPSDLEELLADARELLDADLEANRPQPDVAEMWHRAREFGAGLEQSEAGQADEAVESLPPAVDHEDELLAEINADARRLIDALLEQPRLAPRRRKNWRRRPPVFAAAAGIVLLILAGGALANNWRQTLRDAEAQRFAAAARVEFNRSFEAEMRSPSTSYPVLTIAAAEVPPRPLEAEPPESPESPELVAKVNATKLASLDAEAYARLRAGDRDQAKRKFQKIAKIGGRSEYAELAYGELFALTRRSADELEKLWRTYLKRFPRGRYSDTARAGLCRRVPQPSRRQCWTDYLQKHPRGAARNEALREASQP